MYWTCWTSSLNLSLNFLVSSHSKAAVHAEPCKNTEEKNSNITIQCKIKVPVQVLRSYLKSPIYRFHNMHTFFIRVRVFFFFLTKSVPVTAFFFFASTTYVEKVLWSVTVLILEKFNCFRLYSAGGMWRAGYSGAAAPCSLTCSCIQTYSTSILQHHWLQIII